MKNQCYLRLLQHQYLFRIFQNPTVSSVQAPQAREVTTDGKNKKVWKASEIERMKPWDFEKFEKDIDQARVEGRIDFSS